MAGNKSEQGLEISSDLNHPSLGEYITPVQRAVIEDSFDLVLEGNPEGARITQFQYELSERTSFLDRRTYEAYSRMLGREITVRPGTPVRVLVTDQELGADFKPGYSDIHDQQLDFIARRTFKGVMVEGWKITPGHLPPPLLRVQLGEGKTTLVEISPKRLPRPRGVAA
jgi:hypothetical protein